MEGAISNRTYNTVPSVVGAASARRDAMHGAIVSRKPASKRSRSAPTVTAASPTALTQFGRFFEGVATAVTSVVQGFCKSTIGRKKVENQADEMEEKKPTPNPTIRRLLLHNKSPDIKNVHTRDWPEALSEPVRPTSVAERPPSHAPRASHQIASTMASAALTPITPIHPPASTEIDILSMRFTVWPNGDPSKRTRPQSSALKVLPMLLRNLGEIWAGGADVGLYLVLNIGRASAMPAAKSTWVAPLSLPGGTRVSIQHHDVNQLELKANRCNPSELGLIFCPTTGGPVVGWAVRLDFVRDEDRVSRIVAELLWAAYRLDEATRTGRLLTEWRAHRRHDEAAKAMRRAWIETAKSDTDEQMTRLVDKVAWYLAEADTRSDRADLLSHLNSSPSSPAPSCRSGWTASACGEVEPPDSPLLGSPLPRNITHSPPYLPPRALTLSSERARMDQGGGARTGSSEYVSTSQIGQASALGSMPVASLPPQAKEQSAGAVMAMIITGCIPSLPLATTVDRLPDDAKVLLTKSATSVPAPPPRASTLPAETNAESTPDVTSQDSESIDEINVPDLLELIEDPELIDALLPSPPKANGTSSTSPADGSNMQEPVTSTRGVGGPEHGLLLDPDTLFGGQYSFGSIDSS